ncbi:MAG: hypothetical protein NVSMB69_04790 [Novosphingobium sp.]
MPGMSITMSSCAGGGAGAGFGAVGSRWTGAAIGFDMSIPGMSWAQAGVAEAIGHAALQASAIR